MFDKTTNYLNSRTRYSNRIKTREKEISIFHILEGFDVIDTQIKYLDLVMVYSISKIRIKVITRSLIKTKNNVVCYKAVCTNSNS